MRRVVVIDYDGGNLASAAQTARHVVNENGLDAEVVISGDPETVLAADHIILPGQGAFAHCASGLDGGLREALIEATDRGTPFLGICVGMQLMAEWGLEHGRTAGLGWIRGSIAKMTHALDAGLRLPHMGWNVLEFEPGAHRLTDGLSPGDHGYFVHSYALTDWDPADIVATAAYGDAVPAIVARDNRCGTQFHVEKSQKTGLTIMGNFLSWKP
ncbi:imidazole glycerol phosphate synthase subunit HisH [Asaia lannensis]|uniref:Imidazole glycerol phosphate synthase subunit HisH n=1 Tax=Asaia lannensis NBRC 102526 TaxID=1307926 RepID=A0ABT1CM55_9PROT|nr:imidazole glycerol phosphate synthase subunit HisH [Asaia lannensis]MCO6161099.1 imidazole glycerol phosphate synthase subunit HisH [Asaia lannensis NBRC 102526]